MNFAKDCEAKGSVQEAETFILRMIRAKYLAKYMLSVSFGNLLRYKHDSISGIRLIFIFTILAN